MGNNVEWDIPRMRKAMVVLQECVVTKTLEYGDVGGLFDFVMLLPAAKQARSRDVDDTSPAKRANVGSGLEGSTVRAL